MLTRGDDFPLHQTSEPVAYAGTDRNFYDRYFFNGYAPDGSGFFAAAFGVYPHLNVADAHFCVIRNGVQHCVHASRELNMERMDLSVGPISIEVVEPLRQLAVRVEGEGIAAEIRFTGRAFPIEEPRFIHRIGPRTFMDYTRLTQNGHYEGWIEVDGVREALAAGTAGTRDRSWGVRPVGTSDAQPHGHGVTPQFFWQWTPVNLPARSLFFHINADRHGAPWNTRAVIAPDGAGHDGFFETPAATMDSTMQPGTRWPSRGALTVQGADGPLELRFEPLVRFQMKGLGYTSPKWGHGLYHGPLAVEREDIVLDAVEPMAQTLDNLHVQIVCRVTTSAGETGAGVFEQLVIGPYAPWGLNEFFDAG
ncbi:hypothetical protein [Novosphingobium cyanobacteriorum]|uniref:Uncharacterized protein n=1 Tax=Novosphingobium cyanobacteriorum TaxID=3024215 RepID=A0ABT6CF29_9SPHN|nr:hypothetical protein [Novosphingobium cyanobacteriorum]MDF8331695.1 hypothetical protein [Novosphingobium cyanobacteriorum]